MDSNNCLGCGCFLVLRRCSSNYRPGEIVSLDRSDNYRFRQWMETELEWGILHSIDDWQAKIREKDWAVSLDRGNLRKVFYGVKKHLEVALNLKTALNEFLKASAVPDKLLAGEFIEGEVIETPTDGTPIKSLP